MTDISTSPFGSIQIRNSSGSFVPANAALIEAMTGPPEENYKITEGEGAHPLVTVDLVAAQCSQTFVFILGPDQSAAFKAALQAGSSDLGATARQHNVHHTSAFRCEKFFILSITGRCLAVNDNGIMVIDWDTQALRRKGIRVICASMGSNASDATDMYLLVPPGRELVNIFPATRKITFADTGEKEVSMDVHLRREFPTLQISTASKIRPLVKVGALLTKREEHLSKLAKRVRLYKSDTPEAFRLTPTPIKLIPQ